MIFGMCLGVKSFALAMNVEFRNLDAIEGGDWMVFIASNHFLALAEFAIDGHTGQSGGAPDKYCSLFGACHASTPVGVCSDLTIGTLCHVAAPDSPVPHRTCPMCSDFSALTSLAHCSLWQSTVGARLSLLRWLTGHVRCTPGSPVNYSGARLRETRE